MNLWNDIVKKMPGMEMPKTENQPPDIFRLVEMAKQEWKDMNNYFDNVTDPELIDHAILLREAAERKYMYLLKQAGLEQAKSAEESAQSGETKSIALGLSKEPV